MHPFSKEGTINLVDYKVLLDRFSTMKTALTEKDATIASLQVENEVLREQNLMMNKSGVEKSATIAALQERVKELKKEKYELMSLDTEQDDWLDAVEENDDLKDQIEKLNARIKELESEVSDRHDWQCGCSHWNGCNLPFCASCGRRPYER
jgi:chromosome segregation ATPase